MKGDIGKAFDVLKNEMFFNYRGALIEKLIGGFRWGGKDYLTIQQVKFAVDEALDSFNKNIKS